MGQRGDKVQGVLLSSSSCHARHFSLTESFISGHLEVNVEFLIQIDKLVQLIESPIFTCELYLAANVDKQSCFLSQYS